MILVGALIAALLLHASNAAAADPSVMRVAVVPSAGQMSLVVEMSDEARRVSTQQATPTVLFLEAGPVATPVQRQVLNAPSGLSLLQRVSIDETTTAGNEHVLSLGITMRKPAASTVRVVGRRIYIDFMLPDASLPGTSSKRATGPALHTRETAIVSDARRGPANAAPYSDVVKGATSRFEEIEPFLISATTAPAPNPAVLNAVAEAISDVQQSLRDVPVPAAGGSSFQMLVSAVSMAAESVRADFRGDRAAKAQQSMSVFAAAKAQLQ